MSEEQPYSPREISLTARVIVLEAELKAERAHADRWQALAGRYDDIRDWLRLCSDNPEGHAEFYNKAAEIIFPDAQ